MLEATKFQLQAGDALIVVDVQNDFLPGGSLAVPKGDEVIPVLNGYLARFIAARLPIYATRDWHPPDHCSFVAQGGPWPAHCVVGSQGAAFATWLELPCEATVVSKGGNVDRDDYSFFAHTDLADHLRAAGISRIFVGGLATDYCVLNTVLDGIKAGFTTVLLTDAIRAVEVQPGDGAKAIARMVAAGALTAELDRVTR
jgi:nicotinamidase/pyrazinamidase